MAHPSPIFQALGAEKLNIHNNPFRAKKIWPPDLTKLSHTEQFRIERRYRRRTKLKWARPRWTKGVKIAQLSSVAFITIYGVLFLDWKQENQPFQTIRNWFDDTTSSFWTRSASQVTKRGKDDRKPA